MGAVLGIGQKRLLASAVFTFRNCGIGGSGVAFSSVGLLLLLISLSHCAGAARAAPVEERQVAVESGGPQVRDLIS